DIHKIVERTAHNIRLTKLEREDRTAVKREIACNSQHTDAVAARRECATADCNITADGARAAECCAKGYTGKPCCCRLVAVYQQRTAVDIGRAHIAVRCRQDGGA